jgi:hypothetical protein
LGERPRKPYTLAVRLVASALFVLLGTIACLDPLFCSDGCDQRGLTTTQSTATSADCPTCLSAVASRPVSDLVRLDIVSRICEPGAPAPIADVRADVDHPPRTI